jgi:hypothetical protein
VFDKVDTNIKCELLKSLLSIKLKDVFDGSYDMKVSKLLVYVGMMSPSATGDFVLELEACHRYSFSLHCSFLLFKCKITSQTHIL